MESSPGPWISALRHSHDRLPAEAFVRLLYGRMDESHSPPAESAGVELDELRPLFPGF